MIPAAVVGTAVAVRVVRSRRRRSLHPAGRSFAGVVEIDGLPAVAGRHDATVRVSKGIGTGGGRADVRGLAVRVHLPGRDLDLLMSTAGHGRITRHLPTLRRSFDVGYSTITPYRGEGGEKLTPTARPDPAGTSLGRTLDDLAEGDRFLLQARRDGHEVPVGLVELGRPLTAEQDAELAFDPVRNSLPELHPTGLIHGTRAFAYRVSQRWRGTAPAPENPAAVARTAAHD